MDRLVSNTRICIFTTVLVVAVVVSGAGLATVVPAAVSTGGEAQTGAVGVVSAQESNETTSNETASNETPSNETLSDGTSSNGTFDEATVDPRFENVTVPVEDAEPFEFGTTVYVREQTVLSMRFAADQAEIAGNVSISERSSPAVDRLAANRTVHRAVDITVPENATRTTTTMQMVVRALPVINRSNLEVMRYNEETRSWEPLQTAVVSDRKWSEEHGASVLLLETETPGFSTFAVTEPADSTPGADPTLETDSEEVNETENETNDEADITPHPDATTIWINDRRPYEAGTTVLVNEETVRAITFADTEEAISGIVAVNNSTSPRVDELRSERSVVRAVNITATENASRTPATLHLMVRALAVEDRNDIEIMRYNEETAAWEPLETETVSDRIWSQDHQASVFRVEAETPGFSTFAVTEAPEETQSTSQSNSQSSSDSTTTQSSTDPEGEADSGLLFGFGLFEIAIVALVVVGGAGAVFVVRRR